MSNTDQGTRWEKFLKDLGLRNKISADRHPKRGQKGEADVWWQRGNGAKVIPAVGWKRLTGKKSEGRRSPLGARDMIVLSPEDFAWLVSQAYNVRIEIQAKACAALSVSQTLKEITEWTHNR